MRVASIEDDIRALGAEIIWVLEASASGVAGTADSCYSFMNTAGATQGWCVGDGQTVPLPGSWDDSAFSVGRGFDIVVPRDTMEIVYTTNHGTPSGNDNPTAAEFLQHVTDTINAL